MAVLTNAELLERVKSGLGITSDFQDDLLTIYIDDVKAFMIAAGVPETTAADTSAVGCILRGVIDLWNYGSGGVGFSDYFKMRVTQLALSGDPAGGEA